jgi:hypothetical protein
MTTLTGQTARVVTGDEQEDWRVGFMQKRFSHLINYMNTNLNEETREKLIEELGRACALENKESYSGFIGNIEGFLRDKESKWMEKAEYNKETNAIRLIGKKYDACFCPFAGKSNISSEFCNCTKGNIKESYGAVLGKPVEVTIDSTILRGSDRCCFTLKVLSDSAPSPQG